MTDRMIRRFRIEGEIGDDSLLIQARETHRNLVINMMRDEGYIPLLDLDPVFKSDYVDEKYRFSYTMQGVYVGMEAAWQSQGMLNGTLIPRSTPRNKSSQS